MSLRVIRCAGAVSAGKKASKCLAASKTFVYQGLRSVVSRTTKSVRRARIDLVVEDVGSGSILHLPRCLTVNGR